MNEIRKLNDEELGVESTRVRRAIFHLRSQVVTEKVKDSSQFGKLRGDLARLLTEVSTRRVVGSRSPATTVAKSPALRKPVARKPVARKQVKS